MFRLGESVASADGSPAGGFRLMRYFTITTLIAFSAVALALYLAQRQEATFFGQAQQEQVQSLAQAQDQLARQNEEAARSSLLAVHEASHVNLTQLMANMLWESDFEPFAERARQIPIEHCRALPAAGLPAEAPLASAPSRRACFAEVGRRIVALPGFGPMDAKAYAAMRASTIFKIKVFDQRGITIYSSERGQIGEDASVNQGWLAASAGRSASELTHRDKFSAFEGVVENRDLISTYVPLREVGRDEVVGVFEIYADVTPFLDQIKATSKLFAEISAANEARVAQTAHANQEKLRASSERFLLIIGALLALLYAASWLIVRNGQRLIDKQTLAQQQATQRERLRHAEKMAALATMAANLAHEIGNPLAIISGLAQDMTEAEVQGEPLTQTSRMLLEQTSRIARMTRQIADFATARSETPEWVDVNAMVKAVCDFQGFDRRLRGTSIEFVPGPQLPACELAPDHLNEVMMASLQACLAEGATRSACKQIVVLTEIVAQTLTIRLRFGTAAEDRPAVAFARLDPVRRRVLEMGGQLTVTAAMIEITLPVSRGEAVPA